MFTFLKTRESLHGKFVFAGIEGKDWHAEVQNRKSEQDAVRTEFYKKRAALKMKADPDAVLRDLKANKYKTLKDLADSGKNPTYDVPKMPSGLDAAQTKDYFDKNPDTLNTLFKILKDYFTQVGVDPKKVEREVLLSLHYLKQQDVNVDYLNGGEKVIIDHGRLTIVKEDGSHRLTGKYLRPQEDVPVAPPPSPKPPVTPLPSPKPPVAPPPSPKPPVTPPPAPKPPVTPPPAPKPPVTPPKPAGPDETPPPPSLERRTGPSGGGTGSLD